jgi:hydroxymethylglutaryl-CoA reductase (NADPH)
VRSAQSSRTACNAPVFIFEKREARDFKLWVDDHITEIAAAAEATTSVGKLLYIDTYLAAKFAPALQLLHG